MAGERISIMDAIRETDLQASLVTTFNANLRFYEELVLRRLLLSGSRNNVVVMDRRQCSDAYASAATRPSLAGSLYTLVPVRVSGAFHPKICILSGKKRAHLFVGSHNLTISGFGYNRELSSVQRLAGSPRTRDAIANAWQTVRSWIQQADLPAALIDSALRLDDVLGVEGRPTPLVDGALITQHQGSDSLLDQLAAAAPANVNRITVIGAFFDSQGQFIAELLNRWPSAQVVIGIDPYSVELNALPEDRRLKVVDSSGLGRGRDAGYLHAKALYLHGTDEGAVLAVGSANPTSPAWMTRGARVNTEAMFLRIGPAAREVADELGMGQLNDLPPLPSEALREVASRSRREPDPAESVVPLFVGIADPNPGTVMLDRPCGAAGGVVVALDSHQCDMGLAPHWVDASTLRIDDGLHEVRSLQVLEAGTAVARILVHHPAVIDQHIKRAGQQPTLDMVLSLGSEIDDISRILPALERVIFAGDVGQILRTTVQREETSHEGVPAPRPETLRVELEQARGQPKKSLFAASHDLAHLIEILTHHIHVELAPGRHTLHSSSRTEEEQIGQDDDEPTTASPERSAADAVIAEAVRKRVARLCRRMRLAVQQADGSQEATATVVVQLVAVLALLQELHRLGQTERWGKSNIELFSAEDLELLVAATLDRLFLGHMPVHMLWDSEPQAEICHLAEMLLWAAWLVGYEWWSPGARMDPLDEVSASVDLNAKLLNLLALSAEADVWDAVRSGLERSAATDRQLLQDAIRWSGRHAAVASAVAGLSRDQNHAVHIQRPVAPGDLVDVPGVIDRLVVALNNDGRYVRVGSGGKGRSFDAGRVRIRGTA